MAVRLRRVPQPVVDGPKEGVKTLLKKRSMVGLLAAGLMAAMLPGVASADIVKNQDGSVDVGKGDAQTALGWTNAELQAGAADLRFRHRTGTNTIKTWECWEPLPDGPPYQRLVSSGTQVLRSDETTTEYAVMVVENRRGKVVRFHLPFGDSSSAPDNGLDCGPGIQLEYTSTTVVPIDAWEVKGGGGWALMAQ